MSRRRVRLHRQRSLRRGRCPCRRSRPYSLPVDEIGRRGTVHSRAAKRSPMIANLLKPKVDGLAALRCGLGSRPLSLFMRAIKIAQNSSSHSGNDPVRPKLVGWTELIAGIALTLGLFFASPPWRSFRFRWAATRPGDLEACTAGPLMTGSVGCRFHEGGSGVQWHH